MRKRPDLDVLFRARERVDPQLSPDGRSLAYRAPLDGVLNIWLRDLATGRERPVTRHPDAVGGFWSTVSVFGRSSYYRWSADGSRIIYLRDKHTDENFHVCVVDVADGCIRDLTPYDGVQAHLVQISAQRPTDVAIALNLDDRSRHDLYVATLDSGALRKVANDPGFAQWVVDDQLRARGGVAPLHDGGNALHVADETGWRSLLTSSADDVFVPVHVSGDALYARTSIGSDTIRLVHVDLVTAELTPLAGDARYDVMYPLFTGAARRLTAVVVQRSKAELEVVDEAAADDVRRLREVEADAEVHVVSSDAADTKWVVEYGRDHRSMSYVLYDRTSGLTQWLFDAMPRLDAVELARQEPIELRARDGLTLHGYVLFPPGRPRERLATILLVHGGPATRHGWGWGDVYMPLAQRLAALGYLVLEIDFRGSSGYGKTFLRAGDKEWGAKMSTDLLDAVDWAVGNGFADRERIGIMGPSYGGYAALAGVAFTPEVYRCAVDICGPSSLLTMWETIPAYWKSARAGLRRQIGDPDTEADFLWARSPLSAVDAVKAPVFVAHGGHDPRVSSRHAEELVDALRERGVECDYLLLPDEGHVFTRPESWIALFERLEPFLARHLPPTTEAAFTSVGTTHR